MIKAGCHCGAVRFELAESPEWVLDCNCTLCRRYGALWYYPQSPDKLISTPPADATDAYVWGDKELGVHRCKACGCITHLVAVEAGRIYGVNGRMIPTLDPAKVRLVQIDNSHSGFFWTRSDEPPRQSRHPPMPPPGPDDWR
jgi:hypothetical protein